MAVGQIRKRLAELVTTYSEITMPDSFTISKVIVTLNVQHSFASDLITSLIAPDDSTVALIEQRGGDYGAESFANFVDTVLDQVQPTPDNWNPYNWNALIIGTI